MRPYRGSSFCEERVIMKFIRSKVFVGLAGFALGLGTMFVTQRLNERAAGGTQAASSTKAQNHLPMESIDDFNRGVFSADSDDPFEQMRRMQGRLFKQFNQPPIGGAFGSWRPMPFSSNDVGEIKRREDEKFVYYEIPIKGLKKEKLNVKVSGGQIHVSGQTENKSDDGSSSTFLTSSFHRSFPVPADVDANKVQMENASDRLVIKFPKVV
jgi:HSP20 family molecular chaperone IbpA